MVKANAEAAAKVQALDWKSIPPPNHKDMPQGNIWGLFDKDGKKDKLGTLNYLTDDHVKRSLSEIKTGERVQLDWSLDNVTYPGFGRQKFDHQIMTRERSKDGWTGCDDVVTFNTQSGSQWDGLQHVAHQDSGYFYNGVHIEDIVAKRDYNGIDQWCKAGGIAGRAVLIDWLAWYEATTGKPGPDVLTEHQIPYTELEAVAKYQGTEFKPGDILFVRSGFVRWHNGASDEERKATEDTVNGKIIGVKAEPAAAEWFWNHHFAAVAGDTVAFESWPFRGFILHEWFLTHWGTPIGEMWDLEGLSELCAKNKKWSFFLTSAPLHVPNGVGSPPNAIAFL